MIYAKTDSNRIIPEPTGNSGTAVYSSDSTIRE
jgi:hypothetical protein